MVLQGWVGNLSENGGDIAPGVAFWDLLTGLPTVRPGDHISNFSLAKHTAS